MARGDRAAQPLTGRSKGDLVVRAVALGTPMKTILVTLLAACCAFTATAASSTATSTTPARRLAFVRDPGALYVINEDGTGERRLTPPGVKVQGFAWSPDGRNIALGWQRGKTTKIMVIDANGRHGRAVSTGPEDSLPTWSPSGKWLAYLRGGLGKYGGHGQIWLVRPNGRDKRRLTRTLYDAGDPSWSPRGGLIAYDWVRAGYYS